MKNSNLNNEFAADIPTESVIKTMKLKVRREKGYA